MDNPPNRELSICAGALQLPEGAQRDTYLGQACGPDAALRQRVEALLKAHGSAPPVAAAADPAATRVIAPVTEQPGDRIGRYKLREKVGEGGCGVVYVAEQEEPVRRRVALKVIKLGMDTRSVVARFEAERQALAMMDHPNIAKVLDAGATDAGRPFFVMELVRGIRITDYCDQNKLSTGVRLDLFIKVCQAVQHAHQKGIIHRDLKPSNILVTLHDGVPVPKVIDFGIAKATEGRLTELTVYTELHQFIGTPAYMSPEQAEMSGLDIDTRSDIYSLGVLLYELLTGKTPLDAAELFACGLDEMRRAIREKEPPRPSTRLSTMLNAELNTTAQQRGADSPRLIHLLRGDLDWIAMKALEKDRTRRYPTASDLAMDVQRYVSHEPVLARPPSTLYRFQKLVRRNKTAVAAAGAVLASLVIGLSLSLYLFLREREARQRAVVAEQEQARLREQAEAGLALEAKLREQAERGKKYAEAGLLLSQKQYAEAERVVNGAPPHPAAASIYSVLGLIHMSRWEWGPAITNYARVVDVIPTNHYAYHFLAPLLLATGDIEGYRRLCGRMLRQFGQTSDPAIAERTAKDCLVVPPLPADVPAIARLAETAVSAGAGHKSFPYFQFAKGLSEFRQARFASAVEWLQPVVGEQGDVYRTVEAWATLAMAQHQLQKSDSARSALAKAVEIAEARLPKFKGDSSPEDRCNDWIIAQHLLAEAKSVVGSVHGATGQKE